MNILEHHVTKIWSEEMVKECTLGGLWKMVVDEDCYGAKHVKKHILVNAEQYQSIKEKGFYMG